MELQKGVIIFWNGIYGFISYDGNSIFFHRSSLIDRNIQLLEKVSFQIEINKHGIHAGKKVATFVKLTGDIVNLNEYIRFVGVLNNWDEKRGIIKIPNQEELIHFFSTRKIYHDDKFKNNDLVVFHPVKSTRHKNELFALFAYNISRECDIIFLQNQYKDSGIDQINQYVDQLAKVKELSIDEKFIIKLNRLPYVENQELYKQLVSLLKEYYGLNHSLVFDALRKICSDTYLIQLFETGIIESYDIELMKTYFHNTLADNKRYIITKFQETDREIVLKYHIGLLRSKGLFDFLNDDIKTVLDIVGRNHLTMNDGIYSELKNELSNRLNSDDLITLWLSDYIDILSEAFIISKFDIRNPRLLKKLIDKDGEKFETARKKIFENYFLNLKNKNFENDLGLLIQTLQEFEKSYQSRYEEIIAIYNSTFDNYQKFLLWIFGVKQIDFNIGEITNGHQYINDYYKLKYILRCRSEKRFQGISKFEDEIDVDGLILFIKTNPWNDFIYPVASKEEEYWNINSFLSDIEDFFDNGSINLFQMANEIFESMPKYNTHHIRLWLHNWVGNNKYDYVGFRYGFKDLTKEEQKEFRSRGTELIKGELVNKLSNEVIPCENIVETTSLYKVYSAHLYNFFFEEGKLRFRIEDGSFTKIYQEGSSSSAFNDIPENSSLNKLNISVTVENKNKIKNIDGIDLIFNTIHTKQIEKVLGMPVENESNGITKSNNYVEDYNLIKNIKDYLYACQVDNVEVMLVNEPKNFYRRLDDKSGIDKYEVTALFTHKSPYDFGIVWDNVDYSQDRAIYVFKSNSIELENQLLKLSEAITKTSQFRSTLISSADDKMHELFRANLGYVGSIRKNKGEINSFDKFQSKLNHLFGMPTPVIPSTDEQEALETWDPETPHSVRVKAISSSTYKAKPRQMKDYEIGTVDIPFFEKTVQIDDRVQYEKKITIYNLLRSFNAAMDEIYTIG